jgi:hypothetical protein
MSSTPCVNGRRWHSLQESASLHVKRLHALTPLDPISSEVLHADRRSDHPPIFGTQRFSQRKAKLSHWPDGRFAS